MSRRPKAQEDTHHTTWICIRRRQIKASQKLLFTIYTAKHQATRFRWIGEGARARASVHAQQCQPPWLGVAEPGQVWGGGSNVSTSAGAATPLRLRNQGPSSQYLRRRLRTSTWDSFYMFAIPIIVLFAENVQNSNSIWHKMYISLWIIDRGVLNKCSTLSIVYDDNSRMCFGDSWPLLAA